MSSEVADVWLVNNRQGSKERSVVNGGIVMKPWGYEYCAFDNGKAAVWILHISRGHRTSRHAHPNKETKLILLQGEIYFDVNTVMPVKLTNPLAMVEIRKNTMHQTSEASTGLSAYSENGAFVMEIEEPSDKADIVREDDPYGRSGKPIELATIPAGVQMLKLSQKEQSLMGYTFKLETTLGGREANLMIPMGGELLGIYKDKTVTVADYVAQFIRNAGIKNVFGVSGGGGMYLFDAFHDIFVPTHHEQAAAMAADAYGRLHGLGVTLVTTGPGVTNAMTGVACSWVDSIPHIIISGQVTRDQLLIGTGLRQKGVQETDVTELVKANVKKAIRVYDEKDIRAAMEEALHIATSGRPGPVWVDIPLDVQGRSVEPDSLKAFAPGIEMYDGLSDRLEQLRTMLLEAKRPVLVLGNGVRLGGAADIARKLVAALHLPVLSSWLAADIIPTEDPHYIGRFGIFGDRASNFAVQNADLLIVLGSRLSIPQTGYRVEHFAREAKIAWVDIDRMEMMKLHGKVTLPIHADVQDAIAGMLAWPENFRHAEWLGQCRAWSESYPVVLDGYLEEEAVNSFHFVNELSKLLPDDAVVVTDMGTAFTCTFQAATMKKGQRWVTAAGHAPMGYGIPGAIGAHYATGKKVVCIVGDGSFQFNIQELQTIAANKLPIIILYLNNGGYLTIRHMQANHFGREVGASPSSGVSFPHVDRIAYAYGIPHWAAKDSSDLQKSLATVLTNEGPYIYEIAMRPDQPLIPRSSSVKRPDGSIVSRPIEDLYPFLPREEFKRQMIVKEAEVFK